MNDVGYLTPLFKAIRKWRFVMAIRKLCQWLTVEHVKDAADSLVKIFLILAALIAADLFIIKPNINLDTTLVHYLDSEFVKMEYLENGLPDPFTGESSFSIDEEYNRLKNSCPELAWYNWAFGGGEKPLEPIIESIDDYLDELTTPSDSITCRAIAKHVRTSATVQVSNVGNVAAKDVSILPPQEFIPEEKNIPLFDLAPSESRTFYFSNLPYPESKVRNNWQAELRSSAVGLRIFRFDPGEESTVNTTILRIVTLVLILFWIFAIVNDIRVTDLNSTPSEAEQPPTGEKGGE